MTTLTRMKNGKPVEYVNSQYIPAFLFLPVDILVLLPRELQTLSRSVQDLLHDPKTIATVESFVFWSGVMIGYSLMVWPAMGQEETPESYSYNDPAHLLSATPSCWVGMLERAGVILDAAAWVQKYGHLDVCVGHSRLDDYMPIIRVLVALQMEELNFYEVIKIARENPCHEDFSQTSSTQKRDFLRKWNHSRAKTTVLSLEDLQTDAANPQASNRWEPEDLDVSVEEDAIDHAVGSQFLEMIDETDRRILVLRHQGYTFSEIAEKLGFKTHSAVQKRIQKLGREFEAFADTDLGFTQPEKASEKNKK